MLENTYWNNNGKYQKELDTLQKSVPMQGHAKDLRIEMIRVLGNVYYDVYNNGGCNFDMGRSTDLHAFVAALGTVGHNDRNLYRDLMEYALDEQKLTHIEQRLENAADAIVVWVWNEFAPTPESVPSDK